MLAGQAAGIGYVAFQNILNLSILALSLNLPFFSCGLPLASPCMSCYGQRSCLPSSRRTTGTVHRSLALHAWDEGQHPSLV